jgi:hypothetical protein
LPVNKGFPDENENMKRCMRCAYAGGSPVLCDGMKLRHRARSGECPHPGGSRFALPVVEAERPVRRRTKTEAPRRRQRSPEEAARADVMRRRSKELGAERFRAMWAELHRRALAFTGDVDAERAWMDGFTRRLPCGECRRHWKQLLEATSPDYSSADAYFAWTVEAHNQVNRQLGKSQMTVAEAREAMDVA